MAKETDGSDPWKRPIPKDATDDERMTNAILHLGRIVGAAQGLKAIRYAKGRVSEEQLESLTGRCRDYLEEIEAAAKRAATWLGVTLWEGEYQDEPA